MSFTPTAIGQSAVSSSDLLLFKQNSQEIVALSATFDSILDETHDSELQTTRYTIETGAVLSDQATLVPKRLTLQCFVSSVIVKTGSSLQTVYRDKEAWQQIVDFQSSFQLTTINTTLGVYNNMLLKRVTAEKNVNIPIGNLIGILEFEQQLIANTQFTRLPKEQLKAPAKNNSSTVTRGDVQSETTDNSTLLEKVVSGIGGFFSRLI